MFLVFCVLYASHLSEDGGDASSAVGGLAPAGHGDEGSNSRGLAGGWQARGGDVVVHGQRGGQLDQGQVAGEVVAVPQGVGPPVVGGHLNTVGLAGLPHVVSSGHDVEVAGAVGTVGGGEHVVLGDDRASAEPGVVDEESDLVERWVIVKREREQPDFGLDFTCQGHSWCAASWPPTILHIFTILDI